MCHKFQGTALQHVRAGRCRLKGENRRGPGRWYRTRPRQRPGQAVPAAHRGNLDGFPAAEKVCSCFIQWQGGGGLTHTRTHTRHTTNKTFDVKLKKKKRGRGKSSRYHGGFFVKASAAVAVRARITGLRAQKSARLRVSCPSSFPARTRFS